MLTSANENMSSPQHSVILPYRHWMPRTKMGIPGVHSVQRSTLTGHLLMFRQKDEHDTVVFLFVFLTQQIPECVKYIDHLVLSAQLLTL